MDKTQLVVGSSTYTYRLIEGRQYLVLENDPENLDFTFQEKFDKSTGRPFFVNVVTRSKVWELPDVATLPPLEPMPNEICVGCTVFKTCHSADGEIMFAPEKLPIDLAAGHCWVPQADRIYGRYTYRNAANGKRCAALPPTYDFCQRIQRMYTEYKLGVADELKAFLSERAGSEEEALGELILRHGPENAGYLRTKEQVCAVFSKYDPPRMGEVIELLEQNEGAEKEAALIERLKAQYGDIPRTYRERIEAIFAKYAPERLDCMAAVMATFAEREVGLIAALVKKHGPEPGTEAGDDEVRHRCIAMLIRHVPATINAGFEKGMADHANDAQAFLEALVAKYGPEPSQAERDSMFESYLSTPAEPNSSAQSQPAPASPDGSPTSDSSASATAVLRHANPSAYRERLMRFYAHYNPAKLGSVDKMLRRYEGSEEKLMAELVKTYGPEPPAPVAEKDENAEAQATDEPLADKAEEQPSGAADPPTADEAPEAKVESTEDTTSATEDTTAALVAPPPPQEEAVPPAPQPQPQPPQRSRHFELTEEELKRRAYNIVLVFDPSSVDAVEALLGAGGGGPPPLALYDELLATHGRDPTAAEVAEAEALLARRREAERAREAEAEEEMRHARDAQNRQVASLMAEMEALRVHEAERSREEEARGAREAADKAREAAAMAQLAEAEARRKEAEISVEAVARTSDFVGNDDGENFLVGGGDRMGGFLNNRSGNNTNSTLVGSSGTITVSASVAAIDTATLIGTLTALEEKLQRAYNQMEVSIRKGDALRRANDELHFEINELRTIMAEREKETAIALITAKNESDRLLNEQEREKLNLRSTEQAARAEILASFRDEQRRMSEDMLRMAQESRALNEEVSKQKGEIRELERNIRTLQTRLADKEAAELAARAKLKLLEDAIAARPPTEDSFAQTDDECSGSSVFSTSRHYWSRPQMGSFEELQATVRSLEAEASSWRLRFTEVQTEVELAKAQGAKAAEEYDTALRVINMLRAKNKKLEVTTRALELQVSTAQSPSASTLIASPVPAAARALEHSLATTPRSTMTAASPLPRAVPSSPLTTPQPRTNSTSPLSVLDVKQRLQASEAESRALRKEIADLRGLLALHMSSPKMRR